jgi:hypothetical protein
MTEYIFTNNAKSVLAVAMGGGDATLQVTAGEGALFPSPTSPEVFYVIVKSGSTQAFMLCTSRSTDTLTVTRTDSSSFPVGSTVKVVLNAAILGTFHQKGTERTCVGTPNGVVTAAYAGEEIYDTTGLLWYKNTGGGTVWKAMSP